MPRLNLVIGLTLALMVNIANASDEKTIRCLSGLQAMALEFGEGRADLSQRFPRALFGNLLMTANDQGASLTPKEIPPGDPSDTEACIGEDVQQASIDLLLRAYSGEVPVNPYPEFTQCFAGFMSVGAEVEQEYGAEIGFEFSFKAGRRLGAQFTAMSYLFTQSGPSAQAMQQAAAKKFSELAGASAATREMQISKFLNVCDRYGVSIRSMYDELVAAIKNDAPG